jgi:hypothetical protein
MRAWQPISIATAGAVLVLAFAVPAHAQGKSGSHGNSGKKSRPPSGTPLPSPITGPASGLSPVAWLDDATVLAPGSMVLTVGAMHWSGVDLSELDVPVIDASVGVAKRFQIGANVSRVVGSADGSGAVGGFGTSYVTGKVAVLTGASGVKLAVSPTIEILGDGAMQAVPSGQSRTQFGLPVSVELTQGLARLFASTGFFTRGGWFAGGGGAFQATPKVGLSVSFTRSWASDDTTGTTIDRRQLSGGASYFVSPNIALYGAIGRTIATADDSGAGTTVGGGVTFLLTAARSSR